MTVFDQLPEPLQQALRLLNITNPTPIQARAIPAILDGKDIVGSAPTGTGKTLAFLLPMLVRLEKNPTQNALILSPTRELAEQTHQALLGLLTPQNDFPTSLIIGGDNIHKQYASLRKKPRVIVATPGRLWDHITRKSVDLKQTHFVVLDETDRMLDMGFIDTMRDILARVPVPRQTLLFSATLPKEIEELVPEFLTAPVRVQVGAVTAAAAEVLQEMVRVDIREKLPQLLHELNTRAGSVLVFVNTQHGAERLAKQLKQYGQKAAALHGQLGQNRRRQVLEFFKSGTLRVLVATDLAARGIDVPHIAHVINYDLPFCAEDFIHRTGRTGRAGRVGSAISLVTEMDKWREIGRVTQFETPVKEVAKTIKPLPTPKFVATEESAVRKRKQKKSPYTQRAKELLKEGIVSLPQATKQNNPPNPPKKPKTFHKAVAAARVLETQETLPFKKLKVGASKKNLHKQSAFKPPRRHVSKPFIKRKKRR